MAQTEINSPHPGLRWIEAKELKALTGIRIVAALMVFGSHIAKPSLPDPVANIMGSGYAGVTLFFILSGFVLAWTYSARSWEPYGKQTWNFFVARFARVYPLYLVALVAAAWPYRGDLPSSTWAHVLAVQTWSADLSVAYGLNMPGWSIGVEFFLYALFPFLLLLVLRLSSHKLLGVIVVSIGMLSVITIAFHLLGADRVPWGDPGSAHRWLYRTPLLRVPDFLTGMALAILVRRGVVPRQAALAQMLSFVTIVGLMVSQLVLNSVISWDVAYLVPMAMLLWSLAADQRTAMARFLGSRPMVYGGTISYAFYLVHFTVLSNVTVSTEQLGTWGLTSLRALGATVVTAIVMHHVVEVPAQRFLRTRLSR